MEDYKCCDNESIRKLNTDNLVTDSENACRLNYQLKTINNENIRISHGKIYRKKSSRDNEQLKNKQRKKAKNTFDKYAEQNGIEMRKKLIYLLVSSRKDHLLEV